MQVKRSMIPLSSLLCSSLFACGPDDRDEIAAERPTLTRTEVDTHAQDAYAASTRVWPSSDQISVCFVDGSSVSRQVVRQAVTDTYQFWSNLTFTGWGTCASASANAADIKISFTGSLESFLGTDSVTQYPSMQLRGTEARIGQRYQDALHEFAHAVSLYHESDRIQLPHSDGVTFGTFDDFSASLITYNFLGGGGVSQKDVDFLQFYYPGLGVGSEQVFDAQYYFSRNASVAVDLGSSPTVRELSTHWATVGLRECLRASAKFDPSFYATANASLLQESAAEKWGKDADLSDGGCLGAVVNYVRDSAASGRNPHSSFTTMELRAALIAVAVL